MNSFRIIFCAFLLGILLPAMKGYTQNGHSEFRFWKLSSVSGEMKVKGLYREQSTLEDNYSDELISRIITGGAEIKTNSFFLHPNFLIVDVDGGYFPETNRENFIVLPDRSEVRTVKRLDIMTSFLRQKKIKLNTFTNFDESYQNRENLTNILSNTKQYGGAISYSNKFLPVSVDFRKRLWHQNELSTGRTLNVNESVLQSKVNKSFSLRDRNELGFSHNEYVNENENLFRVENKIDNVYMNNSYYFDVKRKYTLNSMISNFDQRGNTVFKRFNATENLTFILPENLTFFTTYNYVRSVQDRNLLNQNSVQSSLNHKLYKSLTSRIFIEYNRLNHSSYAEKNIRPGFNLVYKKIIPYGLLTMSYMYSRLHQNMQSNNKTLQIFKEQYVLDDSKIVIIMRPLVIAGSVTVWDSTGSIIYMKDLDYLLIERSGYYEIKRIPGGRITNNSTVFVDYMSTQPGSYNWDTDNHAYTSAVLLFNRKLEVYYRMSQQKYFNLEHTELLSLNYFVQNTSGFRLNFEYISGGAEYETFRSMIIPYRRLRYFISVQRNFNEKLLLSLNGNLQDYFMISENVNQRYADVSAMIAYSFMTKTRLNADVTYRNQKGAGIDLDMVTAKSEISTAFGLLNYSVGVELYRRIGIGEKINFKGIYIQLSRKF